MTGKEFFGKLLNNRQEDDSSWEGEESRAKSENSEVDVAETASQEHVADDIPATDTSRGDDPSYVDAPVTELRAPDPHVEENTIDEHYGSRVNGHDELGTHHTNGHSAESKAQDSAAADEDPFRASGGDGLNGDIPDVRPAPNEGPTPNEEPNTQYEEVRERSAEDYLADLQSQQTDIHADSGKHQQASPIASSQEANEPSPNPELETASSGDRHVQRGPSASAEQDSVDGVLGGDQTSHAETASPSTQNGAPEHTTPPAPHDIPSSNGIAPSAHQNAPVQEVPPHPDVTHPLETPSHQEPTPPQRPAPPTTGPGPQAPQTQDRSESTSPPSKKSAPSGSESDKESRSHSVSDADVENIKDRVVQRLLEKNVVMVDQVKTAIADRKKQGLKATLWRILAQQATVDRERVYREAALTYAFVERKIDEGTIDVDFIRQVAEVFPEKKRNRLIELHIVPIGYEFEQQTQLLRVVFITHDPSLPVVRELMQDLNLERYELQYASETTVKDLLARAFPKKNEYLERMSDDPLAYDLGMSYEDEKSELIDEDALEAEINRSSLINLFEGALVEAVHRGASDIHIYPNARRQIEIHLRVDGRLLHWHTEDKIHPESLLAVIKDNTMNVDRFERDMAQDGFIQRKVDETLIRYRVSILPIASASNNIHAESIVIRVLDDRKVITDLSRLGLLKGALERFDMAIRQPHGMVILTGPTGSGKSTTLVAALHQVVTPEVNVLTVEDPVEYIIPDVRQIKLNHKLGLEGALRAILRHDPDVVMVGEMRDKATAELAVKLANTGHLTFSTLHTNDAPSAVSRLYKMGVEPFLIAYAINLVVAQRLLRNLCPKCKIVDNDPDHVLLERLGFTKEDLREYTLFKASGDPTCKVCKGMGYKGRRAISEALYFSRDIRHMIVEADTKIDEDGLRDQARAEGMLTLQDSAREVVKMGETSVDEMMRVTMTEE